MRRQIRTLLVLIPAALAAMAMLASAASASSGVTVLCAAEETPCVPSNVEPAGSTMISAVHAGGTSFSVKYQADTFTCGHLVYGAKTTAESGSPLPAQAEESGPSECAGSKYPASGVAVSTPSATITAAGSDGDGTLAVGTAASHFTVSFSTTVAGFKFTCVFGTASAPLQYDYSEGVLQAKDMTLSRETGSKVICGDVATLNLTAFTDPVYVSEAETTVLCAAEETPCVPSNVEPAGSTMISAVHAGGTSFSVQYLADTFTCGHLVYGAKTTAESGSPLPAQIEESGPSECAGSKYPASGVAVSTPAATITAAGSDGDGTLAVGTAASHFTVSFSTTILGLNFTCVFGTASAPLQYDYSEGVLQAKDMALSRETGSKGICGDVATLNLTAFTDPVYVSRL